MQNELNETNIIIHPIPLIKRLWLYLVLFLMSSVLFFIMFDFARSLGDVFPICMILLMYYIFGMFFLKTRRLFIIIIVPFITAVISLGALWCLICLLQQIDFVNLFETDMILFFLFFFPVFIVWEIAYQILIRHNNKNG